MFDEADRLLALGFEKDITGIVARCPKQRRTGLFSATLGSSELHRLIRVGFSADRNPTHIKVDIDPAAILAAKKKEEEKKQKQLLLLEEEKEGSSKKRRC